MENNILKKLNRRNYENLNYTGDFNEFVYVNAFFSRGVICLISAASYHELTTIIPQSVDIAIYKKGNVRILPEWPNVNIYYYSEKRHNVGIKKINVGNDFFYIYDIDKTVADIVYYREKIGIEETKEIIKNYLNNKDNNAINPIHDMLASNPLVLYFIVNTTNITNNITAIIKVKYNNCSFDISEYTNLLF